MLRAARACASTGLFVLMMISPMRVGAQSVSSPIPRKLTLAQAEELLVKRNLAIVASRYQIDAGRAARLIAGYKPNPIVTLGLEQAPFYSPLKGSFPRFFNTNSDAGANPVWTFRVDKIWERGRKRELRVEQADFEFKAAEAQMLDAIRTQVYELRQAFTAAILAKENLQLAETTWGEYERTERLTEAKVELGDQAGMELYRVRAGRLQFQQAVLQAGAAYRQATRDVIFLLGARVEDLAPGEAAEVHDSSQIFADIASPVIDKRNAEKIVQTQFPESMQASPLELIYQLDDGPVLQTVAEMRSMALERRPDVIAARHAFKASDRELRLSMAQRVRDVSLGYEYQRVGNDHSAGVVVQFPLFVHNNYRAAITQAEAQHRAAEATMKLAELRAIREVEKAYQSYLTSRETLNLYNAQNLAQVEKLRSIAAISYKEGASSLMEMLDAQRYYNQARTAYNQARADYQLSLWQLEQATGQPLR